MRPSIVGELNLLKVFFSVPMEPSTPDIVRCLGVLIDHTGTPQKLIPVVIPHHDFDVIQACSLQGGAQMIPHKISLFFGAVKARVPNLLGFWFILHRHAPDGHTFLRIGLNELDIALGPNGTPFRKQSPPLVHGLVGLHPGRRTPGGRQELQPFI